ncbi:MAG: hypothetical protein LBC44_01970 [Mycoplasmataceae bacterium]|nr:hypothetical protein [Mycoplasmataceae bacterium]
MNDNNDTSFILAVKEELVKTYTSSNLKHVKQNGNLIDNGLLYKKYEFSNISSNFKTFLWNLIETEYDKSIPFLKNIENFGEFWNRQQKEHTLLGDLGEVVFIYFLEKNEIEWAKYYQINSDTKINELFDFSFTKEIYIEVKTTTRYKKEIYIDFRQLPCFNPKKTVFFTVVLIDKLHTGKTILELIEEIGKGKNKHLDAIYSKYKNEDEEYVKSYTYTNDTQIKLVNPNIIPILKFEKEGNYKLGSLTISLTGENCFSEENELLNILTKNE